MKKLFFNISIISAFALLAIACNKENLKETLTQHDNVKILSYANNSVMKAALNEVLSLSHEERIAWETKQGFKSLGSICQEFYETIDPEQFKSVEEIKQFVQQHSNYLQLIQDENGEYTVEIVAYANPYRYLANENGEIKVGESICKVTENTVLDTKTKSTIALSPFRSAAQQNFPIRKSVSSQPLVGSYFYATPTSGSNRLVLEFSNSQLNTAAINTMCIHTDFRVQPYHKTLGIWFQCNRTLTMYFEMDGVLQHFGNYYPFSADVDVADHGRTITGFHATTIPNAPWLTTSYLFHTNSYRFGGSSGSGLSEEWVYKP